ncbi:WhiB family transcriptional regulator [Blastococcus sp. BMG 814]|uniref:WhiB family transcriptional regulator n=1 Tax=Blastococcus carthaginiensis TaxID=3050034 RepID=A0ABT9II55_9ACTN|nr:WhiB family transcriptional regulator [Blastococcus carthaginiensis]MDP5184794.1 WhiB family transcriptional regulator [Blastococcus carthaginiensis]
MDKAPSLLRPPAWTRSAACAGLVTRDLDFWHPHDDLPAAKKAVQFAVARRVCAECPVRHPCALEALEGAIPHGMFGGLDPADRRRIAAGYGYERPGAAAHGTYARYVSCTAGDRAGKCAPCREAKRRYMEARRAQDLEVRTPLARRSADPRAKVLRAVRRADEPVTARAVFRATGVKVSQVRSIVAEAVAAGELPPGRVA